MKQITFILFFIVSVYSSAFADDCPSCHGKRKIKTSYDISNYGLTTEKTVCRYCGETYTKGTSHWDDCPLCGGTGQTSSNKTSSYRSHSSSSTSSFDPFMIYLSPAEYSIYQEAIRVYVRGVYKPKRCNTCNGTGKCPQCNGQGYLVPPTLYSDMVPCLNFNCHAGSCRVCNGTGSIDYYSHDEADIAPIRQRIQDFINIVWEKQQEEIEREWQFAKHLEEIEKEQMAIIETARRDSIKAARRDSIEAARRDSIEAVRRDSISNCATKYKERQNIIRNSQSDEQNDNYNDTTTNEHENSNTYVILLLILIVAAIVVYIVKKKGK